MVRLLAVLTAFTLALPATAQAAELSVIAGQLRYIGAPGKVSNLTLDETSAGTVAVTRGTDDDDAIAAGADCGGAGPITCVGVRRAFIDVGDMSDRVAATYGSPAVSHVTTFVLTINGGAGNDALAGGALDDPLDGGAGNDDLDGGVGGDLLRGGDGNDVLKPNNGMDTLTGGDGIDTASFGRRASPVFSLDGLPNDGGPGENDLIGADVENIEGAAESVSQTVTITGDGRANTLTVFEGRGLINGGEGSDVLEGGPQDDTITSRDGSPDTVVCNGGTDTVLSDTLDLISPSCELVQSQASPGGPFDDRPPALAWTAPAAGAALTANTATTLTVNASDDRGLARVQFLDDDRLVCEDAEAPFACAYQPRGGDVGRNTLIAVAIDGATQTTSAPRPITVRRFTPRDLSLTLRPGRDRRAPYSFRATGRVLRPEMVSPSQGCSGRVTLTARRGSKVVWTRRATLTRTCEYRATLSLETRTASRLRIAAKFGGNDVLATKASRTRTARLG